MLTFLYSILHFLTDGMCAFAMYAFFQDDPAFYLNLLVYNFCAFALQLLFGSVMDVLASRFPEKAGRLPVYCSFAGILFTIAGAFLHPAVLGIGNALFHVGGGIGVIREDRRRKLKGQALGIFVAPGALGLYLGGVFGKQLGTRPLQLLFAAGMIVLFLLFFFWLIWISRKDSGESRGNAADDAAVRKDTVVSVLPERDPLRPRPAALTAAAVWAVLLSFLVVVLRSYAGFAVSFNWRSGFLFGLLATLALVLGKMAGGILSARIGTMQTILASLLLAALCYAFGNVPIFGILALLFFNMTMPITLYLIVDRMQDLPGFSFGLLTLALFIGFVPVWFRIKQPFPAEALGPAVSLVSLLLLAVSCILLRREARSCSSM